MPDSAWIVGTLLRFGNDKDGMLTLSETDSGLETKVQVAESAAIDYLQQAFAQTKHNRLNLEGLLLLRRLTSTTKYSRNKNKKTSCKTWRRILVRCATPCLNMSPILKVGDVVAYYQELGAVS